MMEKVTATAIEQSLTRILADARFSSSPQMSAFLRYVVEEAVAGNAQRIKAYSVAVDALGKPESFDAQKDPCVRVLAMRLRESLADYYKEHDEPVVITIPRGSYKPTFTFGSTQELDTAQAAGIIDVEPAIVQGASSASADQDRLAGTEANAVSNTAVGRPEHTPSTTPPVMDTNPASALPGRARTQRWMVVGLILFSGIGLGMLVTKGEQGEQAASPQLTNASGISTSMDPVLGSAESGVPSEAPNKALRSRPYLPTVHIFANPQSEELIRQIGIATSNVLSKFKNLVVVRDAFPVAMADAWPEDYGLTGSAVTIGETVRVNAELVHTATGTIAYTAAFEVARHDDNVLTARMIEMIESFAAQLARHDGPLFTDYRQRDGIRPELSCLYDLQSLHHKVVKSADELDRLASEEASAEPLPDDHCGLIPSLVDDTRISSIMLSVNLEINAARQASNARDRSASLENAVVLARQAVSQGPYRADTHALLMKTLLLSGDLEQAMVHGARAMELNPFDSRFLRNYARLLAEVDENEQAAIIEAMADKLDPLG